MDKVSDTPRTNFVAHESGDVEWNKPINRFGRMMAHACILERELAAANKKGHEAVLLAMKHEDAAKRANALVAQNKPCTDAKEQEHYLKAVADSDHFFACWQDTLEQRDKALFALKGLLENITEYQTIKPK